MSVLTQEQLKALFETDDMPTQQDFTDLIDTLESNSAVISTSVAGIDDVWVDVNNNNLIDQTTKQINVILHNGTFYLFNGGIGTFGLGGVTPTTSANFITLSAAYELGKVAVQQIDVLNTNATTMSATTLATELATLDPPIVHLANQTTIIRYHEASNYQTYLWFLIDAEPDTYGLGGSTLSVDQLIMSGENRIQNPAIPETINVAASDLGTSDVWTDFNLYEYALGNPDALYIINHWSGTYLFNQSAEVDSKGKLYDWGTGGRRATTVNNFDIVSTNVEVAREIQIDEASYILGNGINLDFEDVNIEVAIQAGSAQVLATNVSITAINLMPGQSGYIRFTKPDSALAGKTYYNWSGDFIYTESNPPLLDSHNIAYFKYEIVGGYQGADPRVLLSEHFGEQAIW